MRLLTLFAAGLTLISTPAMAQMSASFTWGDIPLCTSGQPNIVPNPEFVITGLPEGTQVVELWLKDLDRPGYDHGGAKLRMSKDGTVPSGLFTYKSPCPPDGPHTYEWTVVAKCEKCGVLEKIKVTRPYPE